MNHFIHRVLAAYRPMYLRGLLMDGQYHLPAPPEKPPAKGKLIELTPAFEPSRRRVVLAAATAVAAGLCAIPDLPGSVETKNDSDSGQ
ncbi:hypothetical protein ISP15_04380 [Dyella jejuensis]|uniref:Secreted protein n=1 Tax=Dyella jejuensis TaxID=1432009 RepID=A0ABW8JER9_9GAMM